MNSIREQTAVGFFVLVAAALLIGTILAVSGTFSVRVEFHTIPISSRLAVSCPVLWFATEA